jgi:hypothetical protein
MAQRKGVIGIPEVRRIGDELEMVIRNYLKNVGWDFVRRGLRFSRMGSITFKVTIAAPGCAQRFTDKRNMLSSDKGFRIGDIVTIKPTARAQRPGAYTIVDFTNRGRAAIRNNATGRQYRAPCTILQKI